MSCFLPCLLFRLLLAWWLVAGGVSLVAPAHAQGLKALDAVVQGVAPKMVQWRRDIHQHLELSGQEVGTAKVLAEH